MSHLTSDKNSLMNLLSFELSTERCSVALLVNGELHQLSEDGARPSRRILRMADELLAESGCALRSLDAIAFGRGPGAFTGLRIAAGVVQGIAFGADLPVVPVSSLAALAQRAVEDLGARQILAILDARMEEIYMGAYAAGANGLVRAMGEEQLVPPGSVMLPDELEKWHAVGPGWQAYPELQSHASSMAGFSPELRPDAAAVARLAAVQFAEQGGMDAMEAVPVYLRDTVAWQKTGA